MFAQGGHTSGKVARLISGALALVIGIIFLAEKVPQVLAATDFIVDGTTITLSGEHVFDQVRIINGGALLVAPFDGTAGTGRLKLSATSIVVDATSSIDADGRGFRGILNESGEGPGGGEGDGSVLDGGGGGGYGGKGGRGVLDFAAESGPFDGQGGPAYGSPDGSDIDLGSAGGSAGTGDGDSGFPGADFGGVGGNGGGAIVLEAETITIAGTLTARGQDGQIFVNDSSGGGAGGGIFLQGGTVTISGTLRASGGDGGTACGELPCDLDDGGGGGGGGRIKLFFDTLAFTGSLSVSGGFGARTAERGEDGSIFPFELQPQLVNDRVTFDPILSTFTFTPDPTGCPEGFVGKFSFEARLTNSSESALTDLVVAVATLTHGNLLQNADGGPGGVGAQLTVPQQDGFSDGVLSPQEFVEVPFVICLTQQQPFTFVVDVLGQVE